VIPDFDNHAICFANRDPADTSVNGLRAGTANFGDPAYRYRNAAIASRVTDAFGANEPSALPVVIPDCANHAISR